MSSKPKVAWLSPLPPQKSGIAYYSYRLVKALRPYLDIDLYFDGPELAADLKNEFNVFPLSGFQQRRHDYKEAVYHLGNNSVFHKEIYKLAWHFPSTIVLHDYNISAFMHDAFYLQADWRLYEEALPNRNGDSDSKKLTAFMARLRRNVGAFPMSDAVVNKSSKVIVHHRWVKDQFPEHAAIHVIPLYSHIERPPTQEQIDDFKKRFQISDDQFLIVCLGFTNTNKLPQLQVAVAERLLAHGYPVRWLFAGETAPEVKRLESQVQTGEYRENITFTGYLDETDYFSAVFSSDVVINLRNPSMGEGSATLMDALAAAKPAIVSDINQYKEFPDRVCWKLTHDGNEAELLFEYISVLLSNRNVREALSTNSADYVESVLSLERVIPHWLRVLS
jgi:glycosyltransferase involved in cell wall biosynthesis